MQVHVVHCGEIVHCLDVSNTPLTIGRSGSNELVLPSTDVSGHHLVVYYEGSKGFIKDLGSSNGTFVNGERILGIHQVFDGDVVRLGKVALLKMALGRDDAPQKIVLQRQDGALVWGVTADPLHVFLTLDSYVQLRADGVVLHNEGGESCLQVGKSFEVAGVSYVLSRGGVTSPTVRSYEPVFDYRLTVELSDGVASMASPLVPEPCSFQTDNRVALLFALGQRWLRDGPTPSGGWLDDSLLAQAVWGRHGSDNGNNNLHVLVHRVRADLKKAGFDRSCIEKRQGRTRILLAEVHFK